MSAYRKSFLLMFLLTVSSASAAFGSTPVCTAPGDQRTPLIVSDGNGGAIIAWIDYRNGEEDIFAQRISNTGVALWTLNGVAICTAGGVQEVTSLIPDGVGGAFFAWNDQRSNTYDVYAQRINASGVPQWDTNGVKVGGGNGNQEIPLIVSDGAGGAILAWTDWPSQTKSDILAQRIDGTGRRMWPPKGVVLCNAVGTQILQDLRPDGFGGAIAVWSDKRVPSFAGDAFCQRVGASGQTLWIQNGVGLTTTGNVGQARVVPDGTGGALLAWFLTRPQLENDVYAERVSASGSPLGMFAVCTAPRGQDLARAIPDGSGGAFLVWNDDRDDTFGGNPMVDIYAQHISSSDTPLWALDGVPVTQMDGGQGNSSVASDGNGGIWVGWQSEEFNGMGSYGVFAQHLGSTGASAAPPDTIVPFSTAGFIRIVENGSGGIVATWQEFSGVDSDIRAKILEPAAMATGVHGSPGLASQSPIAITATQPGSIDGPETVSLAAASANPFSRSITLRYSLPRTEHVSIEVFDVRGVRVRSLVDEPQAAGSRVVTWDGADATGRATPPGLYFSRLRVGAESRIAKLIRSR